MAKSRKLPMVRRETQKERSVSFTKRRQGLFNKPAEICMLCDAQIAVLVPSPSKEKPKRKIYSFGNASVPAVLHSFRHNQVPFPLDVHAKNFWISLRNEVDLLQSQSLSRFTNNSISSTLQALDEFELEVLQKLVDGFEKIVAKAKARFEYCGSRSGGYDDVTFNVLKTCTMLSSTEDVLENFKLTESKKSEQVGESINSSQAHNWNPFGSIDYLGFA